jgi:hypothetical protein
VLDKEGVVHVLDSVDDVWDPARPQHNISVEARIAGDVAERPHSLLHDGHYVGTQQLDEKRDGALVNNGLALFAGP